jgi:hypothetical protein
MAKAKKTPLEKPKKKGRYDITVKVPEGMTFEQLIQIAINTPVRKKAANNKKK